MNAFSVTNNLHFLDFLRASYQLAYSRMWLKVLTGFSIFFVVYCIVALFKNDTLFFDSCQFIAGSLIGLAGTYMPIILLIIARINYLKNKRAQGLMRYEFSTLGVNITGETFTTRCDWENLYKIEFLEDWLYIYHNKANADVISLSRIKHQYIDDLKFFLRLNYRSKLVL